jgi:hypothetical protein
LLDKRFAELLPSNDQWQIVPAPADDDPDRQTLLFLFPQTLVNKASYLRTDVKIEMGARSDNEPAEEVGIRPYVADAFQDILGCSDFSVRALSPERTVWGKAMLLHEETYRPPDKKKRKARMARHYYDLWCLIKKGVAEAAAARNDIFTRTMQHREIYFNWTWMDYSTLERGSLRLVPLVEDEDDWQRDYQAMGSEMFFGEVPTFDEILRTVREFQDRFNRA